MYKLWQSNFLFILNDKNVIKRRSMQGRILESEIKNKSKKL